MNTRWVPGMLFLPALIIMEPLILTGLILGKTYSDGDKRNFTSDQPQHLTSPPAIKSSVFFAHPFSLPSFLLSFKESSLGKPSPQNVLILHLESRYSDIWLEEKASKSSGHMVWGLVKPEVKGENERGSGTTIIHEKLREDKGFYTVVELTELSSKYKSLKYLSGSISF